MSNTRKTYTRKNAQKSKTSFVSEKGSKKENVKGKKNLRSIKQNNCPKVQQVEACSFISDEEKQGDSFDLLYASPLKQEVNFKPLSFWSKKVRDLENKQNTRKKKCELYELSDVDDSLSSQDRRRIKKKGRAITGQQRKGRKHNNKPAFVFDADLVKKVVKRNKSTNKKDGSIIREKIILNRLNEKLSDKEDKFCFDYVKSFGLTSTPGKAKKINLVGGSSFNFLSPIPNFNGSRHIKSPDGTVVSAGYKKADRSQEDSCNKRIDKEGEALNYYNDENISLRPTAIKEQLSAPISNSEDEILHVMCELDVDKTFLGLSEHDNDSRNKSVPPTMIGSTTNTEFGTSIKQELETERILILLRKLSLLSHLKYYPPVTEWLLLSDANISADRISWFNFFSVPNLHYDGLHETCESVLPVNQCHATVELDLSQIPLSSSATSDSDCILIKDISMKSDFSKVNVNRGHFFSYFRRSAREDNVGCDITMSNITAINRNYSYVAQKFNDNTNERESYSNNSRCALSASDRDQAFLVDYETILERYGSEIISDRNISSLQSERSPSRLFGKTFYKPNRMDSSVFLSDVTSLETSVNGSSFDKALRNCSTSCKITSVEIYNDMKSSVIPCSLSSSQSPEVNNETFGDELNINDEFELPPPIFESTVCKTPALKETKRIVPVSVKINSPCNESTTTEKSSEPLDRIQLSNSPQRNTVFEVSKLSEVNALSFKPGKRWMRSALIAKKFQRGASLLVEKSDATMKGKNFNTFADEVLNMQSDFRIDTLPHTSAVTGHLFNLTTHESSIGNRTIKLMQNPFIKEGEHSFRNVFRNISQRDQCSASIKTIVVDRNELDATKEITLISARDLVLMRCNQELPIPFESYFHENMEKNCEKIGEGVFGEVFKSYPNRIFKIIPIEGKYPVNGEPQKTFEEILTEMTIALELSNLRTSGVSKTNGFSALKQCSCVFGKYPQPLIDRWKDFDSIGNGSENDSPQIFQSDQLYIILEFGNGGKDLESFMFNSAEQSLSIFIQIACSLAVAEKELEFEHRDLHWGNILIQDTKEKYFSVLIDGKEYKTHTKGVKATIIDYTLSRISYAGCCIFNDLAVDPSLFTSQGDYQFEIYRKMRTEVKNDWSVFRPKTNLLWLHYVLDKMLTLVRYKRTNTKIHKLSTSTLAKLESSILKYNTSEEFLFQEHLI